MADSKKSTKDQKRIKSGIILPKEESDEIWLTLEKQFGIDNSFKDTYGFLRNKKGRLWIATFTALDFLKGEKNLDPAKVLTMAIGKTIRYPHEAEFEGIRLTLDGVSFFGKQHLKKSLIQLTAEEEALWLKGEQFETSYEDGIYILISNSFKEPFGCTLVKNNQVYNFVPKWRRTNRGK